MKLLMMMAQAWAEEHGAAAEHLAEHAHEVVIPFRSIGIQAFNFILLAALLFYLLRKSVKTHFEHRARDYKELVDRAENARREAEKSHSQVKERLQKLEATAAHGVERAKSEATDLRTKLIEEAKSMSKKFEQEAQRSVVAELEKAKAELRKELLEKSLASARENLQKSLGSSDQKKLQNEFVEKIETVGG